MRLPTASALDLARICPASSVLPRVREVSAGMTAGSARHLFLQRCLELGRDEALEAIEDSALRSMCEALELDGLPLDPAAYASEVTFAWSYMTGAARELGRSLSRDYSTVRDDELVGTADTVGLVGDDAVYVSDFKSVWDSVTSIRRNLQLRALGLWAARAYGRERAIIEIIRPGEDRAWHERAELDMFDLAGVAEELRAVVRRIQLAAAEGDQPTMVTGDHCRRCRSISFCPAHVEMVRSIAVQPTDQAVAAFEATASISPEARTRAYQGLKAVEAFTERCWASLRALATEEPIRLDEDRVWGPTSVGRRGISGAVALEVLTELYGDEAKAAAKVEITAAAIERLVVAHLPADAKRGAKGRVLEDVYQRIDHRGGLRRFVRDEVRVHRVSRPPTSR